MGDRLVPVADVAALTRLVAAEPEVRPLGGGTWLLPARAAGLVPIGAWVVTGSLREFDRIGPEAGDVLRLGAAVRLATLEHDPAVAASAPLLAAAAGAVASPALRSMATLGGSLAVGPASPDPATALLALGALVDHGAPGSPVRGEVDRLPPSPTDLGWIVAVHLPAEPPSAWAYERIGRHGPADRPTLVAAVAIRLDGAARRCRVVVGANSGRPVRLRGAEAAVEAGRSPIPALTDDLDRLEFADDPPADGPYRRRVAAVIVGRAVDRALGMLS